METITLRAFSVRTPNLFDTVVVFHGYDEDNHVVSFGVDHRPAHDLALLIDQFGEVEVEVEAWQILGRSAA